MRTYPAEVRIVEVGPRDGLQNEPRLVPASAKVAFIRALAAAGCREIEATSFVHRERVPQLADAEEVLASAGPLEARLSALVPNERGLDRALAVGIRRVAVFAAASETFSAKNIGTDIATSLRTFSRVTRRALDSGLSVRGYVSTAFVCPYEGDVPAERVLWVAGELLQMGVDEISLGDTVGAAVPSDVYERLAALLKVIPAEQLALHFHDTSGTALANVLAGLEMGITTFDSSAGGLGGCPFAPGAAGNLATEDLVYMLERMRIGTGASLEGVAAASELIERHLGHPLPSRQLQRLRSRSGTAGPMQATA